MTEQELEKLIQDKFAEETKKFERPHKFFITENGRGVCEGGDLYNQVFEDVLKVVQESTKAILKEALLKK